MLLGLSFVHPGILGGLALAAIPVVIHILNRRRFRVMEWAAMEFLLKAAVRNRRRIRLENLLLLLLRTLLVVLLVLVVARPFTRRDDPLAALFGAAGATERVILLDDSHSMRAGRGNRAAFDDAKALVRRLVERLHEQRSSDKLTVVVTSRPRRGREGLGRVAVAGSGARGLLRALEGLRPTDTALDAASVLDAVRERFADTQARIVLHVVSDFRRRDWLAPDGAPRPDVVAALRRWTRRAEVRLIDVGAPPVPNAGIVALASRERAVVAGVPATFTATVRNHGPGPLSGISVEFRFDDRVTLPVPLEGTLQPGEEAKVKKEFTFARDGPAVVEAHLPADALPGDDVRRRVVQVREALRFLLVDGEPDPEPYRGEADFLAAALMPPGETSSGISVTVLNEHGFTGRELDLYDGVFLCNVYRLPEERLRLLAEFVRRGGGLVFFLGDQVDPQVYNASFFGRGDRAGRFLMPLVLEDVEGSEESFVHIAPPEQDHELLRFLRGVNPILYRTVSVRSFLRGRPPREGTARVLLRYTDPDGTPALVEGAYGDGRILAFTTAADLEWSDFPRSALYLLLAQECARYVVRPDRSDTRLTAGAPLIVPYDPQRMAPEVVLVPPPESGRGPVPLQPSKDPDRKTLEFRYDETLHAGVYRARLRSPEGEAYEQPVSVDLDPTEGDLRRADLAPLLQRVPGLRLERAGRAAALGAEKSDRTEFWRTLLYALLFLALLESLLAWRFGHHRAREIEAEGKQVFVR